MYFSSTKKCHITNWPTTYFLISTRKIIYNGRISADYDHDAVVAVDYCPRYDFGTRNNNTPRKRRRCNNNILRMGAAAVSFSCQPRFGRGRRYRKVKRDVTQYLCVVGRRNLRVWFYRLSTLPRQTTGVIIFKSLSPENSK